MGPSSPLPGDAWYPPARKRISALPMPWCARTRPGRVLPLAPSRRLESQLSIGPAQEPAGRYDDAVSSGIIHNRLREWDGDGNHPGYVFGCRLRERADQVWLFTTALAVEWTSNSAERGPAGRPGAEAARGAGGSPEGRPRVRGHRPHAAGFHQATAGSLAATSGIAAT